MMRSRGGDTCRWERREDAVHRCEFPRLSIMISHVHCFGYLKYRMMIQHE